MKSQTIYIPAQSPDDWQKLLAEPNLHWKTGYSARTLAYAWHSANGFPDEIRVILEQSLFPPFQTMTPLIILPEHKVPLMGRGKDSQNDLFVLAKAGDNQLAAMTIEGKVEESFGNTVDAWKQTGEGFTANKQVRLNLLAEQLGLTQIPDLIYYQLLHRTASAVIEAKRFNAKYAVMIVHSFSVKGSWFDEYARFAALYGHTIVKDNLYHLITVGEIELYSGWVTGNPKYLSS